MSTYCDFSMNYSTDIKQYLKPFFLKAHIITQTCAIIMAEAFQPPARPKMHQVPTLPGELQVPQLAQPVVKVGITPVKYAQKKKDPQVKSASDQTKWASIYV